MENYVITIARGYGSGGKTIGKMLAQELGIQYYNRDILKKASEESGINLQLFAQADEKHKSGLFGPGKKVYTGELIPPSSNNFISEENLFNYQSKVIRDLAQQNSCVFVGRCADYVLNGHANLLRLYVHAPVEYCIHRVMEKDGLKSEDEALKKIRAIDKERADYYYHHTGHDWRDADNYDLCLNTSDFSWEKSVELIRAYLTVRFGE